MAGAEVVHYAAPQFDYFPTSINISETATYGDVIWSCNATDEDDPSTPEGQLRFEFSTRVNQPKWFLDSRNCDMYVFTGLNYEGQQTYALRIIVKDLHPTSPQTTTGTLTIHITDVNDNTPTCERYYPVILVSEDEQVGREITRVVCTDNDRDISTNGKVMFKVADSNSDEVKETFEVTNNNGSVNLKKQLDYERVKFYVLTIDVYDNGGSNSLTTSITYNIQVKDIDDNKPTWSTNPLTVSVYESTALGTGVFTLTAIDADKPLTSASTITYGIKTPAVPDWFGVVSQTGLVYVKGILNCRIATRLRIEVYAYSSDKINDISVLVVDIRLTDDSTTTFRQIGNASYSGASCVNNDFAPQFAHFPTSIYVPETATLGDNIWSCNATYGGLQSKAAEQFRFRLAEQYDDWSLDSKYCALYVNTRLDYEARTSYTLRVTANDIHSSTPTTTTGTLTIHITDVNDNTPECSETSRVLFVPEDTPINALIATAVCTDADSYGGIFFNVSDSNSVEVKETFEVNKDKGSVHLKKQLDYERVKFYVLTIDVYDNGGSNSLTSITYNIQVKDIDDNKPTWPIIHLTVYVQESAALGTGVFTLTAIDADKPLTAASTITYGIKTPAVPDWFGIDSQTGTRKPNLNGLGFVKGLGSTLVVVLIIILVVVFIYKYRNRNNSERKQERIAVTNIGTDIGVARASSDASFWYLDRKNCDLYLIGEPDYEKMRSYTITIQAVDTGAPPLTSDPESMVISFADVNDNYPVCPQYYKVFVLSIIKCKFNYSRYVLSIIKYKFKYSRYVLSIIKCKFNYSVYVLSIIKCKFNYSRYVLSIIKYKFNYSRYVLSIIKCKFNYYRYVLSIIKCKFNYHRYVLSIIKYKFNYSRYVLSIIKCMSSVLLSVSLIILGMSSVLYSVSLIILEVQEPSAVDQPNMDDGFVIGLGIGIGSILVVVSIIVLVLIVIYKYRNRNHSERGQTERTSQMYATTDMGAVQEEPIYEELVVPNENNVNDASTQTVNDEEPYSDYDVIQQEL
ncbi:hypothetical protein LOTGIDRAFT_159914 [Lottia gigantea]|uniref:Cadherin domain-containing protein n=1 Tax=Lottia gigantea TaxID=225164 RepID=V4AHW5_LOTGI|nr:hypothetical protein LOTGIDRAFT_159914 [Lottia gigantea]ESO96497.1 hypothetical protein LOTGIDRAFT_159914 [Lottia gigantea]